VLAIYKLYIFHVTFFVYMIATAVLSTEFEELNLGIKEVD
jgi:hypothetical protein